MFDFCSRADGGGEARAPGYPQARPQRKEPLKFDADYDFEQANAQFREFLSQFDKYALEEKSGEPEAPLSELEEQSRDDAQSDRGSGEPSGTFYDKVRIRVSLKRMSKEGNLIALAYSPSRSSTASRVKLWKGPREMSRGQTGKPRRN